MIEDYSTEECNEPRGSQVISVGWTDEGKFLVDVISPSGEPRTINVSPRAARHVKAQLDRGARLYLSWGGEQGGEGEWLNG